jgi:cell division septation protein DedD
MDSQLKQRLIGAAVLVALAVVFLPALLKGPDVKEPDAAQVPLSMPATPSGQDFETRELPLTAPEGNVPASGVLGMTPAEPEDLPQAATPPATQPAPAPAASVAPGPKGMAVPDSLQPVDPAPAPAPEAVKAPTPAPAPVAETPATAAGKYMVNIGSFSNLGNANALVAKLRAQKLPVLADQVKLANGSAMRVRVGPYADRATAEAARLRAEEITGAAGKVVASDASASAAEAPKPVAAAATKPVADKPAAKPEPAKPQPAKPAAPANAGGVGFAVQLSAPSVEAEANALRDRARAQGLDAFVQPVETDSGRRYRVRVGPVADRAAAESLRDEVAAKLGNKGIIVSNP